MFLKAALLGSIRAHLEEWHALAFVTLVALVLVLIQFSLSGIPQLIANLIAGPIIGEVIYICGLNSSETHIRKTIKWFVYATIIICIIEAFYRFANPNYGYLEEAAKIRPDIEDIVFYAYKFNSLMYQDSNSVGLQLLILFTFILGLKTNNYNLPRWTLLITFLLICLSISRASIIAAIFVFILSKVYKSRIAVSLVVCIVISSIVIKSASLTDASLETKFEILSIFSQYLKHTDYMTFLLGVGAGNAVTVLGIGAHNIVVSYVVELGFFTSILFILYWFRLLLISPGSWLIFAALFINGFSLTSFAVPFFYGSVALLRIIQQRVTVS